MSFRRTAPMAAFAAAIALAGTAHAATLSETFDDLNAAVAAGWSIVNLSSPAGLETWFQGNANEFGAHAGAADAYAAVNYNSVAGANTISNWLITPELSFNNGDTLSFWTRTASATSNFPDRLVVRFSDVGGNDPATFGTTLLTINPDLSAGAYPVTWTEFTATITGLASTTLGAIAFHYSVPNSGPNGLNGDYIGVDSVTITPVPEPGTWALMALGLGAFALRRRTAR